MIDKYYNLGDLVDRLRDASTTNKKAVTFLVGSALSLPDKDGTHGVPGVSGILDLVRQEFVGSDAKSDFDDELQGSLAHQYQRAFEFLRGRRGPDAANRIVRQAVAQAIDEKNWPADRFSVKSRIDMDPAVCEELEADVHAWALPRSIDLLGKILVEKPNTFGNSVLTTNFDPLIEVSIQKHGGRHYRTVLHEDGNLHQTVSEGIHVVHLHGYWYGYDSLHTPQQLGQPRPQLKKSLSRLIEASTLVVVGYGGWDDIITDTLVELVSDTMNMAEILWTFYESDIPSIERLNHSLITALLPGINRGRVMLYQGIECCSLFTSLAKALELTNQSKSNSPSNSALNANGQQAQSDSVQAEGTQGTTDAIHVQTPLLESDSPLLIEPWVGRIHELGILRSANVPVAFITGLGGQGKSALAGKFLDLECLQNKKRFEFWDWRDCREESDRLNTQVLRLIERLSEGAIDSSKIEGTDFKAVVGVLFRVLENRQALLVFDNVDQYIDLETFELIKGLDYLVSEAQARNHRSFFLFTCRPSVHLDESRAVRLSLGGLTEGETSDLVQARGIPRDERHLVEELHSSTKGHPLWISLIVMQALRTTRGLRQSLDGIKQGGAQLPDTTRTIWNMLNDHQQQVLRTMAELDRPESESALHRILPGRNYNRIHRALSTLKSYHLIEVRSMPEGESLLGLHPIIREFVRTSFPKKDRQKYVDSILDYLDLMIGQYEELLPKDPAYTILEYWARKADFQISFENFEAATSTISEIASPLLNRGYSEELVRLAIRLLERCDWATACSSYRDFDDLFSVVLTQMIQMGHGKTDPFLKQYAHAILGKSTQYILLCDLRCYFDWYAGKFDAAIRWGEEGNMLKENSSVDTGFSSRHNLALARRDAGHIEQAIEIFLDGELLEEVVSGDHTIERKGGQFYGNIGRCLFLNGKLDDALKCYVNSAKLLQKNREHMDYLNRGYIRRWIAELLSNQNEEELAASFYRAAIYVWEESSPPRAREVNEELEELLAKHKGLAGYRDAPKWKVEGAFVRWVEDQ